MTEELRNPDLKDSARRKLVRGAFGVPAVLALHSGSALAASSAANCLVRQNLSPATAGPAAADDAWFRYRLWVIRKTANLHIESYWVKGADLSSFVRMNQTPFLTAASWQEFNLGSNILANQPITQAPSYNSSNQQLVQEGPWVVLRIDAQGGVAGVGASGTGSAVGDSCWNSFAIQTLGL